MIYWSIQIAQKSNCFERIIVSTDDDEIASISKSFGAEVPFMRSNALANDTCGTDLVVRNALEKLIAQEKTVEKYKVCCLYPCSPFLLASDLKESMALMKDGVDFVFAVAKYNPKIQRALKITPQKSLKMVEPGSYYHRSQDLEEHYFDTGTFYWGTALAWLRNVIPYEQTILPFTIPNFRVKDIDTLDDWKEAEIMMNVIGLSD